MEAGQALAVQVMDALQAITGRHEGLRVVHAKGTLCSGTFTASGDAAALTTAAHMQGDPVKAHVRFSNGGGDPSVADFEREGRGLAVKFYLPDGSTTDIVAVSLPVFLVRTPQDFHDFTTARRPDPETGQLDMARVGAFLEQHPEALPAIQHTLTSEPPASYLTYEYNGLHAFGWTNAEGQRRWVRYEFEPEGAVETLGDEQAKAKGPTYLQDELAERLAKGPSTMVLYARIAHPGDPLEDSTQGWPETRERVELGRLEVTGIATDRERDGDVLVFDPTRVTDGIECSDDPILHFRSEAYAESVYRRSGARRS